MHHQAVTAARGNGGEASTNVAGAGMTPGMAAAHSDMERDGDGNISGDKGAELDIAGAADSGLGRWRRQ